MLLVVCSIAVVVVAVAYHFHLCIVVVAVIASVFDHWFECQRVIVVGVIYVAVRINVAKIC